MAEANAPAKRRRRKSGGGGETMADLRAKVASQGTRIKNLNAKLKPLKDGMVSRGTGLGVGAGLAMVVPAIEKWLPATGAMAAYRRPLAMALATELGARMTKSTARRAQIISAGYGAAGANLDLGKMLQGLTAGPRAMTAGPRAMTAGPGQMVRRLPPLPMPAVNGRRLGAPNNNQAPARQPRTFRGRAVGGIR